ncbi:hypothetical protein CNMCM6936_008266 [Aspergillus lentulus]|uniref:SSCRP protein n=1 Tax=Aspergillus lentulus TaxID=293939 RepID=A0AAN5YGV7_ASPLE|nr:hypothetical protein CNMCM6069_007794 [Aspergillus lentulus]KAF4165095.1 hypothetical protein CNMCM6936_008266 [Aspergillus lentulus]KAF4177695.1 hypothetical protein CNMCM7927_002990 [Aspergillus lentulus]KAF4200540.1 hypothetical protein CNMCM8927_002975 [Aspergillus lentulus]
MKVSQIILTSLAVAVSSTAAIKISTGEQINWDENYAVAWKEGKDPCRNDHLLAPVYQNPCERNFVIDSVPYHLANCGTDDFGLYRSDDGSRVGGCTRVADQKIGCDHVAAYVHDVIKHWVCGN